jgi:hypothetical protein
MGIEQSPLAAVMKLAQQPRRNIGKINRIGLAWITTDKGIVWHDGETGGYRSFLGFTADGRRGVVVLANTNAYPDDLGFATLDATAPLEPNKAIVLPGAALDDYVGTYKLADKFLLKVFRMNDGLFARATGHVAFPIFPSAPNEFFAKIAALNLSFTHGPNGAVSGLVLHLNGFAPFPFPPTKNGNLAAPKLSASELPPEPKEIELDAATLGDYVGTYRYNSSVTVEFTLKGDHLEAQITGQRALPIFASAKDKFFYKIVDAQLDFEHDAGGKVVAVVLHQNGRDMWATRVMTEQ